MSSSCGAIILIEMGESLASIFTELSLLLLGLISCASMKLSIAQEG
ncbi:hypothetical protein [Ahrensia kielensis]|nr:hypothetical protein [Ahrensia kielensis]